MNTNLFLSLACFLLPITFSQTAGAVDFGYPPQGGYQTIESENFRLHYPVPLETLAKRLIRKFEQCHTALTKRIPWQPAEKCEVLLVDAMDAHNGWATPLPRNTIALFLADTPSNSALLDPGDYLLRTFIHEYIHILTLDMTTGYRATARKIFGKSAYQGPDGFALLINFFFHYPDEPLERDMVCRGTHGLWRDCVLAHRQGSFDIL